MKDFLICYDIFDKKRLRKVRKKVIEYSLEGQKSCKDLNLDKSKMTSLLFELELLINDEDKINIIKTDKNPILLGIAKQMTIENGSFIIV
jgi:CRISPR-associated endonuclease Cas2